MSTFSQFTGGGGVIKSIQRGSVTPTAATHTVTLGTAVDTSKSVVLINGGFGNVQSYPSGYGGYGEVSLPRMTGFTSTSIDLDGLRVPNGASGGYLYVKFSWQVVEFS